MRYLHRAVQIVWLLCVIAMLWFALAPGDMGGLGGSGFHGLGFAILGLLTPAAFPRMDHLLILFGLVVLGGGIELAQSFTDLGRYGEWEDFFIDVIAASAGIIGAVLIRAIFFGRASLDHDKAAEDGPLT